MVASCVVLCAKLEHTRAHTRYWSSWCLFPSANLRKLPLKNLLPADGRSALTYSHHTVSETRSLTIIQPVRARAPSEFCRNNAYNDFKQNYRATCQKSRLFIGGSVEPTRHRIQTDGEHAGSQVRGYQPQLFKHRDHLGDVRHARPPELARAHLEPVPREQFFGLF